MKQAADDLYGTAAVEAPCGLFAEPGPFDESTADRDNNTQLVGEIIWRHKGRASPITIGELCDKTGQYDRTIKGIVEDLVMKHNMLIGGTRSGNVFGYFVIVDREDFTAACGAYQKQIDTMQKRMTHLGRLAQSAGVIR